EAHAAKLLRRTAVAAPEAAVLTVELVVVLADLGGPGADAALGAADLDEARLLLRERDFPVEPVAAEIAEAPAAIAVGFERIQHLARVILRVRTGHHHAVGLQELVALVVQLPVCDDVVAVALGLEPRDEVRVGRVMPQAGAANLRVRKGDVADAQIEHRPVPGGKADAAAVRVSVVGGKAVLRVLAWIVRIGAPGLGLLYP